MTTHKHDPLMVIQSRIVNGNKGGGKQLKKDLRALIKAEREIFRLRALLELKKEHCMCDACKDGNLHWSDCAVHNAPAMPKGPCDCGGVPNAELTGRAA